MGGGYQCAARYCNNSLKKGYIMKVFPRCPIRSRQWARNAGCDGWIPAIKSFLCEVHFAPEMWERRLDRKPKLKPNAVPTIFGYYLKEKTFLKTLENDQKLFVDENLYQIGDNDNSNTNPLKASENKYVLEIDQDNMYLLINDQDETSCIGALDPLKIAESKNVSEINRESFNSSIHSEMEIQMSNVDKIIAEKSYSAAEDNFSNNWDHSYSLNISNQMEAINTEDEEHVIIKREELKKLIKKLTEAEKEAQRLKKKVETQEHKLKAFRKKINHGKQRISFLTQPDPISYDAKLFEMFTRDQINAMLSKKLPRTWSTETIQRALQLQTTCGNKGYVEIQRMKIPLPNLRTLRRVRKAYQ